MLKERGYKHPHFRQLEDDRPDFLAALREKPVKSCSSFLHDIYYVPSCTLYLVSLRCTLSVARPSPPLQSPAVCGALTRAMPPESRKKKKGGKKEGERERERKENEQEARR